MTYQIKLQLFQINNFEFDAALFSTEENAAIKTELQFQSGFKDDKKSEFAIFFNLILTNENEEPFLKLKSAFYYETDKEIEEEFKESSFVKISAPAIAFPYLRTFISNFTLNSGHKPIMLPSINFIKMTDEGGSDFVVNK